MENTPKFVLISELKEILGMQSQYIQRYLLKPEIVEGLEVKVDERCYHDTLIREDHVEELAERIQEYDKNKYPM